MAAQSPVITSAAAEAGLVKNTLLAAIIARSAYVLRTGEILGDLTQPVGLIYPVVHSMVTGYAYYYNSADTTTPDDGLTCLVDFEGRRYIIADTSAIAINAVLEITNTPPGSPVDGDAYIAGTAPTGDFSGHPNDVALYTPRGWVFATPKVGMTVFNIDTETNYQFDANGDWVFFAVEPLDGSLYPVKGLFTGGVSVETQQDAPPAVTIGPHYLVGAAPSGAWAGHANDVAYSRNGTTWEFLDPYEGMALWIKSLDYELTWDGAAWVGTSGSNIQEFTSSGADTWTKPPRGSLALVQLWGAGGSGGRAGPNDGGGGGGGGAYVERLFKLSDLAATVAVGVGAGGASRTSDEQDGIAGGNTTFGALLTGYGGGGGGGAVSVAGGGGGGGGSEGAGATAVGGGGTSGGAGGGGYNADSDGGDGGNGTPAGTAQAGGAGIDGGAGGGGGGETVNGAVGGNSRRGGGGGGGGSGSGTPQAGGTSRDGGNGGAGATSTTAATAGSAPGGGGGGTETGNSGAGGTGRARVTVW